MDIVENPGCLTFYSSPSNPTNFYNLGNMSAPSIVLTNVKDKDFSATALFRDIEVPVALGLWVGPSLEQNLKVSLHANREPHHPSEYMVTAHNGGAHQEENVYWEPGLWENGDDVRLTLNRTAGDWTFSWENLTNNDKGQTEAFSFEWLADDSTFYVSLFYLYGTLQDVKEPVASQIEYFAVYDSQDQGDGTGDLNGDGKVDSRDLDIVRACWGMPAPPCREYGDADADGWANSRDLDVIRSKWGTLAVAAPEPTIVCLLLAGIPVLLFRRQL